jgi:hypothetical protein
MLRMRRVWCRKNILKEWLFLGCYAVWLLLSTDVSEELMASMIKVTKIGELGTLALH